MAQLVETKIDIEGKEVKQFSSFVLSQSIFEHHAFRLVCPTEAIDGKSGGLFNTSKNMIGSSIKITVKPLAAGAASLLFNGVITQVESAHFSGHAGDIIVSGYSPTIMLDNGPHCKTWEKKAVKNIAQDVLRHFPQNLLQPKITPSYGETLSYTVQYKETGWQFLTRLAATYGEWLYYDGQKLIMGVPQGAKLSMTYGNTLSRFNMAMQLRPPGFHMMAYDYMNNEVYHGEPQGIASQAGLNDLGKHTLEKSQQFYDAQPRQWNNHFLTNKKQLDDFINMRAAMQTSNMVRFNGHSSLPGVQVGATASVQGKNVFSQQDESYGDFLVIGVTHSCDGQGHYNNEFVALPASVKVPPVVSYTEPLCETQSALVTDNHDPKGLGRVRVKFHWMADTEKSPWLRVTSLHGGEQKGMFFIPEIGEEVIVGFEGNSPVKPYVIGSVYHGKAKTDFSNDGNDVKVIQTRSGNKMIMNDKEGSVFVEDKDGNNMKMDGEGNIKVTSNETIVLECGDAKIELKKDGTVNITGKKVTTNATEKAEMKSGQASFGADGNGGNADMKGMKASVEGTTEAKLSSNAQTNITAAAKVAVQGAMITLN